MRATLLQTMRQRRRTLQALATYRLLIATPEALASAAPTEALDGFQVLASAEHAVVLDEAMAAGDLSIAIGPQTLGIPALDAGIPFSLGFLEFGQTITVTRGAACPAGTLSIQVRDAWRRGQTVATGTFS